MGQSLLDQQKRVQQNQQLYMLIQLQIQICKNKQDFNFYQNVSNITDLMLQADIAIGAAGTTTWERCCLGLPSLITAIADNQIEIGIEAEAMGIVKYLGISDDVSTDDIADALSQITDQPEMLKAMSRRAIEKVDGKGAVRIASILKDRITLGVTT